MGYKGVNPDDKVDFNAKLEDARYIIEKCIHMEESSRDFRHNPDLTNLKEWWNNIYTAFELLSPYMEKKNEIKKIFKFLDKSGEIITNAINKNSSGKGNKVKIPSLKDKFYYVHRAVMKEKIRTGVGVGILPDREEEEEEEGDVYFAEEK